MALAIWDDWARFLIGSAGNVTSQFGEDGLIKAVFERIGVGDKWCFEIGAGDGVRYSNVNSLIRDGWGAVLIEGDPRHAKALDKMRSSHVTVVTQQVGGKGLDDVLTRYHIPPEMDLGVIDIDGQDYWLWKYLTEHTPRVMLVEYGYYCGPKDEFVPEFNDDFVYEDDHFAQASLASLRKLGAEKGYTLLASTYCNLLFVRTELMAC